RRRCDTDGRESHLTLTAAGREAFAPLDRGSHDEVAAMLAHLADGAQVGLTEAMASIERLLGERPRDAPPYLLRPHQPGDMGWVAGRHGALYAPASNWKM